MTLDEAKAHLLAGGWYADVCGRIAEGDRAELAAWYAADPRVPNLTARMRAPVAPAAPEQTGEGCKRCGGLMVRTGTCMTCQGCGESSGGCG